MNDFTILCPVCRVGVVVINNHLPTHKSKYSTTGALCYGSHMPIFEAPPDKSGRKKIEAGNIFFIPPLQRYEEYGDSEDDEAEIAGPIEKPWQNNVFKEVKIKEMPAHALKLAYEYRKQGR